MSRNISIDEIDDRGAVRSESLELHEHDTSVSAELSAGDVDARWDQAESTGEETAGGSVATPDQSVVDDIGKALGITYDEGEPLRLGEKEEDRDRHRWELDPASAEDFASRNADEAHEAERIRRMGHRDQYKPTSE